MMGCMSADPDLFALWARGWALTRDVAPPVWDDGGWRIEVAAEDQLRRFLFSQSDEAVARRAARVHEPKVFLKVCAPVEDVEPLLPKGWIARQTGAVMTLDGMMRDAPVGEGYSVEMTREGAVTFCSVRSPQGVEAGRGRAVMVSGYVIYDRIAVEPPFRRQGVGRLVMRTLQTAMGGTTKGVLTATTEGRALYRALGWRDCSPYTTAVLEG